MRIKSYYSQSIEQAMAMARAELGPDAMLVNSRKAPIEARHLGAYEVVCALEASAPQIEAKRAPATPSADDRLSAQIADLKRDLDGMRRSIAQSSLGAAGKSADFSEAYSRLTASDLEPELARDIVQAATARSAGMRTGGLDRALALELESRFRVEPELGRSGSQPLITALVGPPGAGKTTTLVKLAVNFGLAARRSTVLLSMDTYRMGAAEQLRSFATVLGIGFQLTETPAALALAIEEHRGKSLILIDTPGFGWGDMDAAVSHAQFLSTRTDVDIQLVLPASMKPADLARTASAYEIFRPQHLLFTRLDETGSFGPILSEAIRSAKPLSFFATGQRIPEDLESANAGRLLELILGTRQAAAAVTTAAAA